MKKTFLSLAAIVMMGFASVSCGSHTAYRSYSSDGENIQQQREWKRCAVCDGKGSCNACKGTGKISGDNCRSCKGTGKCNTCKGNGGYYIDN